MSIDDVDLFLVHQVWHKPLVARGGYAEPSYSTGSLYRARVTFKTGRVRGPDNETIVTRGMVWFGRKISGDGADSAPDIKTDDQIVLPDGSTPPIVGVDRPTDDNGPHHTRVIFG